MDPQLDTLRDKHARSSLAASCLGCGEPWPCDTATALEALACVLAHPPTAPAVPPESWEYGIAKVPGELILNLGHFSSYLNGMARDGWEYLHFAPGLDAPSSPLMSAGQPKPILYCFFRRQRGQQPPAEASPFAPTLETPR